MIESNIDKERIQDRETDVNFYVQSVVINRKKELNTIFLSDFYWNVVSISSLLSCIFANLSSLNKYRVLHRNMTESLAISFVFFPTTRNTFPRSRKSTVFRNLIFLSRDLRRRTMYSTICVYMCSECSL